MSIKELLDKSKKKKKKRVRKGERVEKSSRNKMWHEYNPRHPYNKLRSLKDPELKSEVEKWYKILEQDGFQDVERDSKMTRISGERAIPSFTAPKMGGTVKAKQSYYSAWQTYYVHHEEYFSTKYEALIYEGMGEGLTFQQISDSLKASGFTKNVHASTIRNRVAEWEEHVMLWNKINANGEFYEPPSNVWRNENAAIKARKKGSS
jgi:hypothetical protein